MALARHRTESGPTDPSAVDPGWEPAAKPAPIKGLGLTADGRLRSGRLAGLTMRRAIWVLCWPVLVESFLHSLVGLTDTVLASALEDGDAAMTAIGGASYMMWFIGLIIMAIGIGATALISRAVGAGRVGTANAGLGQTVILSVTVGMCVGAIIALSSARLAVWLNMSEPATRAFNVYMRIVASGVPMTAILFAGTSCARGAGDSFRPLWAMVVVNIVNMSTSWMFAGVDLRRPDFLGGGRFLNPLHFDLGVGGIALGTICGHAIGAIIILVMAGSGIWGIRLKRRWLRPHRITIWRLLRIGVPNFLETFGLWIGNFIVILFVGWLGSSDQELLGVHVIAIRLEAFSFMAGFAIGTAAATLAGQYLGARSPEQARRAVWSCAWPAALIQGSAGLVFLLAPRQLVWLLSDQPVHLEFAPALIMIAGAVQIPFSLAIVFRQVMRGAGDVKFVMAITWITTYGVRVPLTYLLSGVEIPLPQFLGGGVIPNPSGLEPSLSMLWVGLCAELVIRGACFTGRFLHGGWTSARV